MGFPPCNGPKHGLATSNSHPLPCCPLLSPCIMVWGHWPGAADFRGETRWRHPHCSCTGFLLQCPATASEAVTLCTEQQQHKLSDLPGALQACEPWQSQWGFQLKAVPLPGPLVPAAGPRGAPSASLAAGQDRESFGLCRRRTKREQSKGAARPPSALGCQRGAPPPGQPGCCNIPGTA